MNPRNGFLQTLKNYVGYLFFKNSAELILYLTFPSFLPTRLLSFFLLLSLSPHPSKLTHRFFQELGHSVLLTCCFFIIHLVSVFFHVQVLSLFKKLRGGKKTMLSVSINLHPERVTSYQGFKSASWFSDLLSVLINADTSHTQDTRCQLLSQLCAAFHFRNKNLDYLFITV